MCEGEGQWEAEARGLAAARPAGPQDRDVDLNGNQESSPQPTEPPRLPGAPSVFNARTKPAEQNPPLGLGICPIVG